MNLENLLDDALEYATKDQGHVNILIAGRSGVGKSTLINSVFQSDFAETGKGKPVTRNTVEIVKEGFPLSIFDTRGLEMTEFSDTLGDLERIVSHRCSDKDERRKTKDERRKTTHSFSLDLYSRRWQTH
ncbi:GTPase [uncultured Endozoicomonas sp.]|uniref:GTPase n=1 Tax=uncultured Endozoicomonas sp. TaxID=432652 RepID=UPI00263118DC|nr:GTPase [uncultured Endozoicomonas sp.]